MAKQKKFKFKVQVNPFTQEAIIKTKIGSTEFSHIMYYEEADEFNSFEIDDYVFDIHFHYDQEFTVSIYPVIDNVADYINNCDVKLTLQLSEQKYKCKYKIVY